MKAFKHLNAASVEEAIALIHTHDGHARLMAGGTDLLGVLKDEVLPDYPEAIINIKTIAGLDQVTKSDDGINVGALTRLVDVAQSQPIRQRYPMLSQAAQAVATPEIRNMATLGGNLCQETRCWYFRYPHQMGGRIMCLRKGRGPCQAVKGDNRYHAIMGAKTCFAVCPSDTAIALSALDARLQITGAHRNRMVPIDAFFASLGHVVEPDELLTSIQIPSPPSGARQAFVKFTLRKPVDFAIASVAALITVHAGVCTEARIALGAVAPTPIRAVDAEACVTGKAVNQKRIEAAAEAALKDAKPMRMNAYKVEVTKTLVKRALRSILL